MNRSTRHLFLSFALAAVLAAAPLAAGELQGVTVSDTMEIAGQTLVLNGMALRKVAIVNVYVAGLWLPARSADGAAVLAADGLRHVEMHWLRDGGKGRICDGWYEGLEANTPGADATLRGQFDTLCEWMVDAEKGDVFAFTYLPGIGTDVQINGQSSGVIPGRPFADALWAVWIGEHPGPGERFKKDLLGG